MNSGAERQQPSGSWSTNRNHPDRADWLDLAVDAGRASLLAQREELSGMRTRAVAFGALTVTASAFLVGTGLANAQRSFWFYVLAVVGTLGFVLLAGLLVAMVSPRYQFRFTLDPKALVAWMDGSTPAPSKRVAMRTLATKTLPDMMLDNERSLSRVRSLYRQVLGTAVVTLAVWILIVWVFV